MSEVLLFDWSVGGHHGVYLRRFSEALVASGKVYVACADDYVEDLADIGMPVLRLGPARPGHQVRDHRGNRQIAIREMQLMAQAVDHYRPSELVHMYGDPTIRHLSHYSPLSNTSISMFVFRPRAHSREAYGNRLANPYEYARAQFLEHLVRRFVRRPDARSLLTLDEKAAERWQAKGYPAHWIPEPPVAELPDPAPGRRGAIMYGAIAPRKGLDLLAAALAHPGAPQHLTLAGNVESGYVNEFKELVQKMRQAGTIVRLAGHCSEHEGLRLLSASECAILPYPRHFGMSRVLVESASVGTPVIVHDHGQLAFLVRHFNLGVVTNCHDPVALRSAIDYLTRPATTLSYEASLRDFADRYSRASFAEAVHGALGIRIGLTADTTLPKSAVP